MELTKKQLEPIATWDPFRELEDMSTRLNHLFGLRRTGNGGEALTVAQWTPLVDVSETDKEYVIKAELPEIRKEDVKVDVAGGVLTIKGERKQEKEEKGKKWHRVERSYGSFLRSFTLPSTVDPDKVAGEFKDGLLTVHLTKADKPKPKATEIKIA